MGPVSLFLATAVYFLAVNPLLQYANAVASRELPRAFEFTLLVFRPEPLEIPGYFLGFLAIPVLAWGIEKVISPLTPSISPRAGLRGEGEGGIDSGEKERRGRGWPLMIAVPVLGMVLYKVITHLFWFDYWRTLEQKGDLKVQLLLVISILIFVLVYVRGIALSSPLVGLLAMTKRPWFKPVFFLVIAILLFSPNFPFDHFHYDYFLSTVNDLRHNKSLLYDTTNQYGVLQSYFLYFLTLPFPKLSYQILSLVFFIVIYLWFLGWYFFLKRFLKSELLAAAAILAQVILFIVPWADLNMIYDAPGNGPYRQVAFLVLLWAWIYYLFSPPQAWGGDKEEVELQQSQPLSWPLPSLGQRSKREWALLLVTALGFYWFVDNGIFLVLTTLAGYWYWRGGKKVLGFGAKLLGLILVLGGVYSVVGYLTHGAWPQWKLLYETAGFFQKGFLMYPLPSHGAYYFYVVVYLGTLLYVLKNRLKENLLPLLLAFYGIWQLTYYISRSYTENLAPRNGFILIALVCWWIVKLWDTELRRVASAFILGAIMFLTIFGGYVVLTTFSKRDYSVIKENFSHERLLDSDVFGGQKEVVDDIKILKHDFGSIERPAILHWHDVKILLDLNKTNFFYPYDIDLIYFQSQMDGLVEEVRTQKPQYLFIGRPEVPEFEPFAGYADKYAYFRKRVEDLYLSEKQLNTIDILRRR